MLIQPPGTQAFPVPNNRDATGRRDSPPPSENAAPPIETQTPHAASQAKPVNNASPAAIKKEDLEKHLHKINDFVQARASNVQFVTDKETGIDIVKVIDTSTKEIIRQMPSEEVVQIAKALDQLKGLLIRQKA